MSTPIKAPAMGESIAEATVAKWLKKVGDVVAADEMVAELETDKVNLEVVSPVAGVLESIATPSGATVKVGEVMAVVAEGAAQAAVEDDKAVPMKADAVRTESVEVKASAGLEKSGPAVRKLAAELHVDGHGVAASGKDGRLTKADVMAAANSEPNVASAGDYLDNVLGGFKAAPEISEKKPAQNNIERVEMTRIRKTIASRLKQSQNTAAMLTTWNEVDLLAVNTLRNRYKDAFEKKYGVKLGYMGFFTKAVVTALQEFPALNAEIDGEDILYKHYYDIGIAVSSPKGLVVPVVRGADGKSLADIEADIGDYGKRARDGGLKPDELQGATFSITNGGVFGSLMSMPILNYPQVGILGMHAIKDRPVVVDGQIVVRPMMYLALTYDHRIVDGREAVSFLVRVKENLEDPARMVLGL